jgi:hypothetical protein
MDGAPVCLWRCEQNTWFPFDFAKAGSRLPHSTHCVRSGFARNDDVAGDIGSVMPLRFAQNDGMGGDKQCHASLRSFGMTCDGRAWNLFYALWPLQWSTPRNLLHGPTAWRYWWAMILEIWCRWVMS